MAPYIIDKLPISTDDRINKLHVCCNKQETGANQPSLARIIFSAPLFGLALCSSGDDRNQTRSETERPSRLASCET